MKGFLVRSLARLSGRFTARPLPPISIRQQSLLTQLVILAAIALIPGLLAWGLYLHSEWNAGLDKANDRSRNLVDRVVSDFDGALRDYELSLSSMAAQSDIQAMSKERCLRLLPTYAAINVEFTAVTLHDPDGKVICSSLSDWAARAPARPPPEIREYFDQAIKTGRLVITDPMRGPSTGRWIAALAYPVRDDSGAVLGMLFATLDMVTMGNRMLTGIREPGFSEDVLLTVLDRQQRVAMRSQGAENLIGKPARTEMTHLLESGDAGGFQAADREGQRRIWAYTTAPRSAWTFAAGLPENEALAGYRDALLRGLALGGALILLLLAAIWWLAEGIAAPMRKLAQAAQAVAGRDLAARADLDGASEVREVSRQFNQMIEAIVQHRQQDEHLHLLETCIEQINEIVLINEVAPASLGPRILFVNEAFVRTSGYSREEALGQSPTLLLHGPSTDRATVDRIRLAVQRGEPCHAEIVNHAKNGLPYWVALDLVPVRSGGAEISHYVCVQRDITERKQQEAALRQLNAELESRVRSRTEELQSARDDAQQANRAKSAFLATMSHEIRTPMNGVIGMVEVLQQAGLQSDQIERVALIRDSAFSLLSIIDSILDFSKIEAGHFTLEHQALDLPTLVEKVCAVQDQGACGRGVRLSYVVDPALPSQLLGDETRIRQILINLIGNAIKFSGDAEASGAVRVDARLLAPSDRRANIELLIADNGVGMDEATVARLFKPFTQADASTTRRFGGTGLGLAITANLVHLMQGTIAVESRPGQGTSFRVRLPLDLPRESCPAPAAPVWAAGLRCQLIGEASPLLADLHAALLGLGIAVATHPDLDHAAAAAPQARPSVWIVAPHGDLPPLEQLRRLSAAGAEKPPRLVLLSMDQRRGVRSIAPDVVGADAGALSLRTLRQWLCLAGEAGAETLAAVPPALAAAPAPPRREDAVRQGRLVLVAEDNETNRKVIRHQLDLIGIAADIAVDGREALERWRSGAYALLLTDLHMPEMDGYELAAAIRAEEPHGRRTPILALTANAMDSEEQRCLSEGMDAYLTKPVRLPQLRQAIERWLSASPPPSPRAALPSAPLNAIVPPALGPLPRETGPADLSVLRDLVGDDEETVAELLESFSGNAFEIQRALRQCVQAGSLRALADQAHKLKSGARTIGARRLAELCAVVEAGGPSKDPERLPPLIAELNVEIDAVREYIEQWLLAQRSVPATSLQE